MASCGIYQDQFDCPPGKGIGCTPVHEVLDLIVEKSEGEDLFVKDPGTALLLRHEETRKQPRDPSSQQLSSSAKKPPSSPPSSQKPVSQKLVSQKSVLIRDEAGDWKLIPFPSSSLPANPDPAKTSKEAS